MLLGHGCGKMTRPRLPSREEIGPDTPLRLGVAAALRFLMAR